MLELSLLTALVGVDLGLAKASPLGAVLAFFAVTPATIRTLAYARRFEEHGLQPGFVNLVWEFGNSLIMLYPIYFVATVTGMFVAGGVAFVCGCVFLGAAMFVQESWMWTMLELVPGPVILAGLSAAGWVLYEGITLTWPHRPNTPPAA